MYLFDTDIVIELLRNRGAGKLRKRIEGTPAGQQHLSAISLSELVYGACRSKRPEYHLEQIREVLLKHFRIVDFDLPAAWRAGQLRARLARDGCPINFPDLQIASIALSMQLVLITGNVQHFARVPDLTIENWLEEG